MTSTICEVNRTPALAAAPSAALEEWGKLLNDVPTAGPILDRFLHHAQVIAITGRSYRVKDVPKAKPESKKHRTSNEPPAAGAAS